METTTMRVTRETKARLERLQDEWRRRTGARPTLQVVLDELSKDAERDPGHIIDHAWTPPGRDALDAFLAHAENLGAGTGDIDDVVYGDA